MPCCKTYPSCTGMAEVWLAPESRTKQVDLPLAKAVRTAFLTKKKAGTLYFSNISSVNFSRFPFCWQIERTIIVKALTIVRIIIVAQAFRWDIFRLRSAFAKILRVFCGKIWNFSCSYVIPWSLWEENWVIFGLTLDNLVIGVVQNLFKYVPVVNLAVFEKGFHL